MRARSCQFRLTGAQPPPPPAYPVDGFSRRSRRRKISDCGSGSGRRLSLNGEGVRRGGDRIFGGRDLAHHLFFVNQPVFQMSKDFHKSGASVFNAASLITPGRITIGSNVVLMLSKHKQRRGKVWCYNGIFLIIWICLHIYNSPKH